MAAHLQGHLQQQGMALITPPQGRRFFQYLLGRATGQVAVLPVQPQQLAAQTEGSRTTLRDLLDQLPATERKARLESYVRAEIAAVLRLSANTPLDAYTRLFDFGLDSLMAVELKNKLERQLACTLRATVIFDYPTLAVLLPHLYQEILGYGTPTAEAAAPAASAQPNLETLSAQELDDLLEQELAFLEE